MIKVYLPAVRFWHIAEGKEDPFQTRMERLQYILQGVKREEASRGHSPRVRLPITPAILRKLKAVWQIQSTSYYKIMLWVAVCLGFFGFLRAGEMTVPSDAAYDPTTHLSRSDITVDDLRYPSVVRVTIKQSKTDPFQKGIDLFIGKTEIDLCPVAAILGYLVARGLQPGPLLIFQEGRFLIRERLVSEVREALQTAGLDQSLYCGNS